MKTPKDALVPEQSKPMNTLEHSAKEHGHAPRRGTMLRITKDTRHSTLIHQKGELTRLEKNSRPYTGTGDLREDGG